MLEEYGIPHTLVVGAVNYCLNDGDIVPNGAWVENGDYKWYDGSEKLNATKTHPFGFLMYCDVKKKEIYKLKSGKEVIEYKPVFNYNFVTAKKGDKDYYLKWIHAIPGAMSHIRHSSLLEIEYTEERAKLFVDMIKGIAEIAKKMDFLQNPNDVKKFVQNNNKALLSGN